MFAFRHSFAFHHSNVRPFLASKQKSCGTAARMGALFTSMLAGFLMASTSSATAQVGFQSVFDCGDVIGKVFDDQNRNGHQDKGELGLPGVRLLSVRGLTTITDEYGRYHVTCAQLPRTGIGSNFVLKLDARSLPTGYRITTENPRAARLTAGRVSKMNFGVSISRVVRLGLADAAFEPNSTSIDPQWSAAIDQLIGVLSEEPSVLRVIYEKGAENRTLASKRMRAVSRLVEERWQERGGRYRLEIERRMKIAR